MEHKLGNTHLDTIYNNAINNGASGGKLLGAGGGGFFLFYVAPTEKHQLIVHLEESGLNTRPFCFEKEGLRSWTVRESKN